MNAGYKICILVNITLILLYGFMIYLEPDFQNNSKLYMKKPPKVFPGTELFSKESFTKIQHQRQETLRKSCLKDPGKQQFNKNKFFKPSLLVTFQLPKAANSSSTTNSRTINTTNSTMPSTMSSTWLMWCPVLKAASSNWFYRSYKYKFVKNKDDLRHKSSGRV